MHCCKHIARVDYVIGHNTSHTVVWLIYVSLPLIYIVRLYFTRLENDRLNARGIVIQCIYQTKSNLFTKHSQGSYNIPLCVCARVCVLI